MSGAQYFRKIYLSLYSKGLCVRRELETEQNCNTLTPPTTLLTIAAFLSRSPGLLNRGPGDMVLIPATSIQLIWTSCRRGYIIIWCPPTTCKRHISHSIQPVHSQGYHNDTFDRMHLFFYTGAFLIWQPDQDGGQYTTTAKNIFYLS